MINKKSIIILAFVVVILVGAFFAVNYLWDVEESDTDANSIQSIELFTTSKENIVRIDATVEDESFSFVYADDKWVLKDDEDVKLKYSSVDYLAIDLAGVYAKQLIEEKATDLDKYGLAEPMGTYTLYLADGVKKTFLIGKQDPVTEAYYFKVGDTDAVYTIYSNKGNSLMKKSSEYKDSAILDIDSENIRRIYMKKKSGVMELDTEITVAEDGTETIVWKMLQPMERDCDSEPIIDNIISKISYITVSEFIDSTDARYSEAGVERPRAVVKLIDKDEVSQTIYVGKEEGESCYIKTNGRVYLVNADCVSFLDIKPFIYITKFINLENITEVAMVEVSRGDVTHTVTIEGEEDNYTYKLNDKEVMEDTFKKKVYQKIIGLLADDFAEEPKYSEPEYGITFYMNDGGTETHKYCEYDDRNYAAFNEDGSCEFIIRKKKLEEMFASLDAVAAGRVK